MLNNKIHQLYGLRLGGGVAENFVLETSTADGTHRPGQIFIDSTSKRLKVAYANGNKINYYTLADLELLGGGESINLDLTALGDLANTLQSIISRLGALESSSGIDMAGLKESLAPDIEEMVKEMLDDAPTTGPTEAYLQSRGY